MMRWVRYQYTHRSPRYLTCHLRECVNQAQEIESNLPCKQTNYQYTLLAIRQTFTRYSASSACIIAPLDQFTLCPSTTIQKPSSSGGCAIAPDSTVLLHYSLPPSQSIFSAEVLAISTATLQHLIQSSTSEDMVCTDFLSAIQALSILFALVKRALVKEVLSFALPTTAIRTPSLDSKTWRNCWQWICGWNCERSHKQPPTRSGCHFTYRPPSQHTWPYSTTLDTNLDCCCFNYPQMTGF